MIESPRSSFIYNYIYRSQIILPEVAYNKGAIIKNYTVNLKVNPLHVYKYYNHITTRI